MNMREIRQMARERGAMIGNMTKVDAVRMIQLTEGNFDCFAKAADGQCDQGECLFHADCVKLAMKSD